jgi:lysophospholipase L1-like esterase
MKRCVSIFILLCFAINLAAETTILPLGDSITQQATSYRKFLVPELKKRSFDVRFVGPNRDAISAHAGYGGRNTAAILNMVDKIYAQHPADVVLLHSGHNSFAKDKPVAGIIRDTEAIIRKIHAANPKATVLLAQVITAGKLPKYSYIPDLHAKLAILSKTLAGDGIKVVLVDQATGFDWRTDTVKDRVHPSPSGAIKMADNWLQALEPLLADKKK